MTYDFALVSSFELNSLKPSAFKHLNPHTYFTYDNVLFRRLRPNFSAIVCIAVRIHVMFMHINVY